MSTSDIFKIIGASALVFGLIALTVLELPHFSNTHDMIPVLWKGGAIWISGCLLAGFLISRRSSVHWSQWMFIALIFGVFSFPLASSWMNRIGRASMAYPETLVFLGMDARIKDLGARQNGPVPEPDEYHIYLGDEDAPVRLIVDPAPFWLALDKGDSVTLQWIPGRLGGKLFDGVEGLGED